MSTNVVKLPENSIANLKAFLQGFADFDNLTTAHIFTFKTEPVNKPNKSDEKAEGWYGKPYRKLLDALRAGAERKSFYISSIYAAGGASGVFNNKNSNFGGMWCVVLDDIGEGAGSKANPLNLPLPTRKIESSEGNFQYIYAFSQPITDLALAKTYVRTVYNAGLSDSDGCSAGKFFRLPLGIRNKLVDGKLDEFVVNWDGVNGPKYDAEDLLTRLGLTIGEVAEERDYGKDYQPEWLNQAVPPQVLAELSPEHEAENIYRVRCPNHEAHTNGTDGKLFVNSPTEYALYCHHSSCRTGSKKVRGGIDSFLKNRLNQKGVLIQTTASGHKSSFEDWVFYSEDNSFYNTFNGSKVKQAAFNIRMADSFIPTAKEKTAVDYFLSTGGKKVDSLMYVPAFGRFFEYNGR